MFTQKETIVVDVLYLFDSNKFLVYLIFIFCLLLRTASKDKENISNYAIYL